MVTIVALKSAMSSHFPLPKKLPSLFRLSQVARLFFPSKKWIKLIPKTIGNRKRDSAWGCARGINTTRENLQIAKHKSGRRSFRAPDWFVLCDLQIFSGGVYPLSATSRTISFSISNSFWFFFFLAWWCYSSLSDLNFFLLIYFSTFFSLHTFLIFMSQATAFFSAFSLCVLQVCRLVIRDQTVFSRFQLWLSMEVLFTLTYHTWCRLYTHPTAHSATWSTTAVFCELFLESAPQPRRCACANLRTSLERRPEIDALDSDNSFWSCRCCGRCIQAWTSVGEKTKCKKKKKQPACWQSPAGDHDQARSEYM